MQIDHPNAEPLSDEQKAVLDGFRKRLESMVSSHGLTGDDMNELIRDLKSNPLISAQLLEEARSEVTRLLPGQQQGTRETQGGCDDCRSPTRVQAFARRAAQQSQRRWRGLCGERKDGETIQGRCP